VGRSPSAHPRFNKDGGATDGSAAYITGGGTLTGNDQLSITVPLLGAVDLSTLLQGAGVYAACAGASISSIKVYPRGGTGTAVTLGVGTNTVSSSMDLLDASGNVVTANALNYTTTFVGASTSAVTSALTAVPVVGSTLASAVNAALYPATGTITAGQTPTQGYYAETYRVDLTY
jgi:hypothetical protein